MIDSSVTFLDSGIGGLPYLDWVRNRRPDLRLSYVADTKNFPYGELPAGELRAAVVGTVRRILDQGIPKVLVIACNTASVVALDAIRDFVPCPVVGTVPAVKPAATLPNKGPIGVLATRSTVDSPYLDRLIESFAAGRSVIKVAAADIVRFVEERLIDEGEQGALKVMDRALNQLRDAGVSSVVIGCTHFLHVLDQIRMILGEDVTLVDSRDGVGRRILWLLDQAAAVMEPGPSRHAGGIMTVTGSGDERYRKFADLHHLDWMGVLP